MNYSAIVVAINWFIASTTFKSKLSISQRAPGRYSSRFRICAAFVELYCLTHTERTSTGLSKLNQYLAALARNPSRERGES